MNSLCNEKLWGFFFAHTFASNSKNNKPSARLLLTTKKNKGMKKIVIGNKVEFEKLKAAFPSTHKSTIYRALNFQTNTLNASRIRCYAMNFLQSAELLTTH